MRSSRSKIGVSMVCRTARVTAHLCGHGFTRCSSTHITKCKPLICILILPLRRGQMTYNVGAETRFIFPGNSRSSSKVSPSSSILSNVIEDRTPVSLWLLFAILYSKRVFIKNKIENLVISKISPAFTRFDNNVFFFVLS